MKNVTKNKLHLSARLSLMALAGLALALAFSGSSAFSAPSRVPATTTSPKIPAISKSQPPTATGTDARPNGVTLPAPQPLGPWTIGQPLGPWMMGTPYPITIVRYGFAQTATHFYVFGGVSNGSRQNVVNRMEIATGIWQSRAPMPFTSEAPTCALMASTGIVYCAEGDTGNHFASYNIATDAWTSLANTPNPTDDYGSASGAFNGKVFLAGGTTGFSNAVWVYDVASNTWSAGTSAPDGFLLAGYQQVGQFLYLAGGWTGGAPTGLTTTRRLDMSSAPGVWNNGPAFTMGRSDFGLAYDAGMNKLYALGGDAQGGGFFDSTNEVDELDLSGWPSGTWNLSPPNLPSPARQANQAGFYNGDIWSVGGINGGTFQFLNEVWHRTNGGISCPECPLYVTTTSTGNPIVPGTTDIGNHCDDCATTITLPFPVTLYGTSYTSISPTSNGSIDFVGTAAPFGSSCPLPDGRMDRAILPFQTDGYTSNTGYGIFTSVTGTAPNRDFNIEWRNQYYPGNGNANYEVIFHENSPCFDIIYGATDTQGSTEASGVQKSATGPATQFSCNEATLTSGLKVTYCPNNCPAPVPTDAVSRKTHGAAGPFDIELPRVDIHGAVGIEDRIQGAAGALWAIVANYPLVSESVSVSSDGTFAYGAGGYSGGPTNSFNRYDPVANTWTPLPNVPGAFYDAPSVYAPNTNRIYVFGGIDASFNPSDVVQIYDIASGTWVANGTPMPGARYFASAAYYNGKIYVIGGFDSTFAETSTTWEYDPVANTWNTSRAPIPVAMGGAGYSIVGQFIYLAGHWSGGAGSTDHYRYDIVGDSWASEAPVPVPIYRPDAASIGTNEYLVGGGNPFVGAGSKAGSKEGSKDPQLAPHPSMRSPEVSYNSTYIYDTVGNTWSSGPNTNVPHSFTGGTAIGNLLIVVTGYNGSTGDTNTVEALVSGAFNHQMVITFAVPVTVESASVTTGVGTVSSFTVVGNVVTVNLSGVTNAQRLEVTLHNVCDGTIQGDVLIPMGVLDGDVNSSGDVNSTDVALTKSKVGQTVMSSNFREDVNANGTITSTDVTIVKSKVGTALPP